MKILWLKMAMATLGGAVLSLLVLPGRVQAADTSTKSKQESLSLVTPSHSLRSKGTGTLMNSVRP